MRHLLIFKRQNSNSGRKNQNWFSKWDNFRWLSNTVSFLIEIRKRKTRHFIIILYGQFVRFFFTIQQKVDLFAYLAANMANMICFILSGMKHTWLAIITRSSSIAFLWGEDWGRKGSCVLRSPINGTKCPNVEDFF